MNTASATNAGAPIPAQIQGKSLRPVLKNPKTKVRTELVCEYFLEAQFPKTPSWRALRSERYKYVHYPELKGLAKPGVPTA